MKNKVEFKFDIGQMVYYVDQYSKSLCNSIIVSITLEKFGEKYFADYKLKDEEEIMCENELFENEDDAKKLLIEILKKEINYLEKI